MTDAEPEVLTIMHDSDSNTRYTVGNMYRTHLSVFNFRVFHRFGSGACRHGKLDNLRLE